MVNRMPLPFCQRPRGLHVGTTRMVTLAGQYYETKALAAAMIEFSLKVRQKDAGNVEFSTDHVILP